MSITRCPHCGTANRAGSNFCNGCGTDLRDPSPPPRDESPTPDEPNSTDSSTESGSQPSVHVFETPPEIPSNSQVDSPATDLTTESATLQSSSLPADSSDEDDFADQPWLRLEFVTDDDEDSTGDAEDLTFDESGRLVTAVQGLLAPIRVATNIADNAPVPPIRAVPTVESVNNDELRLIRGLMAEPPTLVNYQVRPAQRRPRSLRIHWLFALLGLAVGLPAFLLLAGPVGRPYFWPGVEEAYITIQGVAPDSLVVVYWAYDQATAGEVNLAMQPVMRHLLQRRARIAIISTVPGGIATAERLIAQVRADPGSDDLALAADLGQPITYAFLPGGAASLPFFALDPTTALLENILLVPPDQRQELVQRPALVIAAAAQAEDVQNWLEQVQPLDFTPVVAVTTAGAGPILRPYLDSNQLFGLVSGFDGAYAYRQLLQPFIAPEDTLALLRQIVLQNWGHVALLAAIALGNIAALLSRETNP